MVKPLLISPAKGGTYLILSMASEMARRALQHDGDLEERLLHAAARAVDGVGLPKMPPGPRLGL